MKLLKRILKLLGVSSVLFSSTANAAEYTVGQVWSYNTRAGEETSRLIIVAITPMKNSEVAYSIFIEDVKIKNPHTDSGFQSFLPHAPLSKDALDKSVKKLIEIRSTLPDFEEGFAEWKQAFDSGEAGVFSVTVAEILSFIEEAVSGQS